MIFRLINPYSFDSQCVQLTCVVAGVLQSRSHKSVRDHNLIRAAFDVIKVTTIVPSDVRRFDIEIKVYESGRIYTDFNLIGTT